jgi:hypothetical protein
VLFGYVISLLGTTVEAATPSSGTLSTTNSTLSYNAGPFAVPNVTAQAGDVICNAVTVCDDFSLTVTVPADYQTGHNLTIKVEWANTLADFDLYVLNASGAQVGSSASSSDPEVVILPAVSGTYTVRVVPFAPLGESFKGTASLTDKPTNPPPATGTPPTYQNYAAPNGLGTEAGEPSIGANWKTGKVLFQSFTQTLRVTFNDTVSPATATWEDKSAPTSVTSLDPILFTDHATGRTFVSQLVLAGSLSSYSDDDGETWSPSQGSGIASGVDHQTIGGGPFAPSLVGPLGTYPNIVYYCSQDIADALCATSRDGGLTYGPAIPIYTVQQCGGLHGHVKVAPDGTAYVPNKGCGGQQAVVVSTDNGLTWAVRPIPGSTAGESDPSVGIGANGTIYVGYQNGDGHPRVAVSHDRGLTWENNQDVGTTFNIQNTVFPAVVAGDDDRAAFAFLGTPTAGNFQDQATFQGIWHLYIAHTYDGGKSWITSDATPNDPVQRGSIWLGGGSHQDRNLLDFMDATVDNQGRMLVGYADGCIDACVQGGPNSYSALGTIARQTGGKRLFAKYDQPDLTVTNVAAYYNKTGNVLTANIANPGFGNASNVIVRFLDGSTVIGESSPTNLASGATAQVVVPWKPTTKGNRVITAVIDPANAIAESNENNNQLQKTISTR